MATKAKRGEVREWVFGEGEKRFVIVGVLRARFDARGDKTENGVCVVCGKTGCFEVGGSCLCPSCASSGLQAKGGADRCQGPTES